jgi:hypothetical protein
MLALARLKREERQKALGQENQTEEEARQVSPRIYVSQLNFGIEKILTGQDIPCQFMQFLDQVCRLLGRRSIKFLVQILDSNGRHLQCFGQSSYVGDHWVIPLQEGELVGSGVRN